MYQTYFSFVHLSFLAWYHFCGIANYFTNTQKHAKWIFAWKEFATITWEIVFAAPHCVYLSFTSHCYTVVKKFSCSHRNRQQYPFCLLPRVQCARALASLFRGTIWLYLGKNYHLCIVQNVFFFYFKNCHSQSQNAESIRKWMKYLWIFKIYERKMNFSYRKMNLNWNERFFFIAKQ